MSSFSLSPVNCNFKISLILSTHICSPHSPLEFFGPIIMDYTWTILLWRLFAPMQWYLPEAFSRQRQLEYLYMLHHKWSHDLSNKNNLQSNKSPRATWNGDEVALHHNQENLGFARINKKVVWHNTTLQHDGYPQQLCVTWINVFRRKQENIS